MLEAIAYNVRIRGSEYARYYFFLRDIAKAHHVERDAASSAVSLVPPPPPPRVGWVAVPRLTRPPRQSTERLSILQKPGERFATSLEVQERRTPPGARA